MQKLSSLCQKINKVNPSFFAFVRFYRISLSRFGQLHQENGRCFRHSGRRAQAAAHTPPSAPTQHSASAANTVVANLDLLIVPQRLEAAGFHISQATEFFGYLTGMAVPLINLATIFTAAMTISLVPAISESRALNDVFGIRAKTRTAFRVALIITCPCFVGMYFLAEKIAALIYNAPGAADAIQTMSVGILLLGLHQISTGILQGLGRTSIPVINMILAAAVKVFLSWTLTAIPTLGIKGAAMATVVDFGLAAVLNMIFIYKYTGFALSFSGVFKPAVSAAAMGAAVYGVITLAVSWGAWAILAAIAVAVPVYGGVLLAVGGIGKDDLESLPFIGHRLLAAGQKLGYFR